MRKIPVCDLWARHWAEYETRPSSLRAQSDARSKIGHLALWVIDCVGKPVAAWPDALALLDPAKAPDGVAAFVRWKRHECPGRKWNRDVSVTRGCAVLAQFFDCAPGKADARIAKALRTFKP